MLNVTDLIIGFFISFVSTLFLVYPIKKLAIKLKVMDIPDYRKIHITPTPRLGGLAIFLGTCLGLVYLAPSHEHFLEISIGALIIVITGILDDKYQIRPIIKLSGQLLAAGILVYGGLIIDKVNLPLIGLVELQNFSIIITILWVVGIANAINLIDGLDGLASGVSTIALTSILIIAITDFSLIVIFFCVVLIGSNLGFLFHNFHPAKIYMGDTGSMFLGYSIAVISMLGLFKNVTLFSFLIPIIVLAVPIFDTLFSMLRRFINKQKIMMPDKKHIHYQLLAAGFSHRNTVIILYGFSAVFGALAILFSNASIGLTLLIAIVILILLHLLAEMVGVVGKGGRPILKYSKKIYKMVRGIK
ncbi:undecaprenyl-phosphate alpha-N-acetylglucosaminyl 1-phosphate transferase [Aquibacillus halophilus]|uniref:Undecaprenyl-phosphate alpha-N-acetylglucosaminyl 1-phosphate transferase n=1 Tax=Aquibacillus halophilus TaxID=930132 RepID=A0A6A8DLR6_9BACI|nr:MraY family glycosyltransferase [Aquibacillus halophilus]MRH43937.1 undecaprenyl-phosphate alpha-N-acetylglucosaminyl 1-phosphate transferase [Aquibacillus halophilus]